MNSNIEIERKFLLKRLPDDLSNFPSKHIRQGYIAVAEDGTEVRLREKGGKHFLTVKSGAGMKRAEYETEISPAQFDTLWPATENRRVEKTRYELLYRDNVSGIDAVIEIDVYEGTLEGLLTMEVEFGSESESASFNPPDWTGLEITEDKRYKNQILALRGIPQ